MQAGIPYALIGPAGDRVVFNDRTDPDFVGFLDGAQGITGLLDVADTRESADDLVEGDGGVHGPFWMGRRSGTINGWIEPVDAATNNLRVQKLKRASRALRDDSVLRWTEAGRGVETALWLRRAAGKSLQITDRWPKKFQLSMVSAAPVVYAYQESSLVIVPGSVGGELGVQSPISSPLTSVMGVSGQSFALNQGDIETWPRFRIDGPIQNPSLLNNTTGKRLNLTYTLGAGEFLMVDFNPRARSILLGGTANRASALQRLSSAWWPLVAGNNDVRLLATGYSAGAQLTCWWRSAWE